MIHSCRIHCHTMDTEKADLMGIKDTGKWLPFAFHMDVVIACKVTSDDPSEPVVDCTTIFTDSGDTYIIDTPYDRFFTKFKKYHDTEEEDSSSLDL